jgi:hypothetical protein
MGLSRDLTARELAGHSAVSAGSADGIDQVVVRVLPDGRMSQRAAARYLGCSTKTLAAWRLQGKGPRSVRVGRLRFFFKSDLDAFIARGDDRDEKGGTGTREGGDAGARTQSSAG